MRSAAVYLIWKSERNVLLMGKAYKKGAYESNKKQSYMWKVFLIRGLKVKVSIHTCTPVSPPVFQPATGSTLKSLNLIWEMFLKKF
jgi:hypothetical protein